MTRGAARPTRTAGDELDGARPAWPGEPPRARVADMGRSLEFYLHLGCEVRSAADGWALLGCGSTAFVLVPRTAPTPHSASLVSDAGATVPHRRPAEPPSTTTPWIRLTSPDVRALRWRLLAKASRPAPSHPPAPSPQPRRSSCLTLTCAGSSLPSPPGTPPPRRPPPHPAAGPRHARDRNPGRAILCRSPCIPGHRVM